MSPLPFSLPVWLPLAAVNFFLAGLAGIVVHYISKRARREITGSLYHYLFVDTPGYTLATVLALVAADFGAVAALGIEDMKISTLVATGFTAGWAIDSSVTQATPAPTTTPQDVKVG